MNSRNALGFAGVITQDMHYWESDPFIMHQREDLLLHLMFTLRNVCLETMQGDLTGGNCVTAENASLHIMNGTARVAWDRIRECVSLTVCSSCLLFLLFYLIAARRSSVAQNFLLNVSLGVQVQQIETSRLN